MKISVLQHAAFEGPGEISTWAEMRGHVISVCHLYRGDALPAPNLFDVLVVMGGEMNIHQYRDWPWLKDESAFIKSTLESGVRVIGICLGAQLIADALGARVVQNPHIELGWFPVKWTKEAHALYPKLPAESSVLHWHGDTFALPLSATRLAVSEGCPEQGYAIPGKCLGLQFHMEVDPGLVASFVESQGEWHEGPYIQAGKTILRDAPCYCDQNRQLLHGILDEFCR